MVSLALKSLEVPENMSCRQHVCCLCLQMPYEDVLPYPEFAVHLREHALYRLPEVLEQIIATKGLVRQCLSTDLATCLLVLPDSE